MSGVTVRVEQTEHGADQAMAEFARAFEDGALAQRRLWFDLSGMVQSDSAQARQSYGLLALRIRQIGSDRILIGSDGTGSRLALTIRNIQELLPLSRQELELIFRNRAGYLQNR